MLHQRNMQQMKAQQLLQGLLGRIIFGESLTPRWLTGMAFILAGLFLITRACCVSKPQTVKLD